MKQYILCCLLLLAGCAYRTIDKPINEPVSRQEIQQPVQKKITHKSQTTEQISQKKALESSRVNQTKTKQVKHKPVVKKSAQKSLLKCNEIAGIRLYQLFNSFAMGQVCVLSSDHHFSCNSGQFVYMLKETGHTYTYDQIIQPGAGECFAYNGTFSYKSKGGVLQTVPKLKLIQKPVK